MLHQGKRIIVGSAQLSCDHELKAVDVSNLASGINRFGIATKILSIAEYYGFCLRANKLLLIPMAHENRISTQALIGIYEKLGFKQKKIDTGFYKNRLTLRKSLPAKDFPAIKQFVEALIDDNAPIAGHYH